VAKKLSKTEKRFCDLYLKTRDVLLTKLKLGYEVDLNKKRIREYIAAQPIEGDIIINKDALLRRLYAIATFDHASMIDEDGDTKPLRSLTDEQRMAIRNYREHSDGEVSYTTFNQQQALMELLKRLDALEDTGEDTSAPRQVIIKLKK
jgi:hypothetical protein